MEQLPRYDDKKSYEWNYENAPSPVELEAPTVPGKWRFVGLPVDSPLGMPAGPLLNGTWCLYYASLGFDVLTYKTVRSAERKCYPLPNLQPVECDQLPHGGQVLSASKIMRGSWAVSFGMPSKSPDIWRRDVEATRARLPKGKLLSVSVVGTMQDGWTIEDLARDYARCAQWAVESGADAIETNYSCPNVSTCDGQLYQQPSAAATVAACVRESIGKVPLIIKIGHEKSEANAFELIEAVAPYVSAVATTNGVAVQVADADGKLIFDGQRRGICGAAIREATVQQVQMLTKVIRAQGRRLEVIGVGGASSADDVRRYLSLGATAVHIATAAMSNPLLGLEMKQQLSKDLPPRS